MEPDEARSEESAALRTEDLQAELVELSKDVLDRTKAAEDRQEAADDRENSIQLLRQADAALEVEITARSHAETELERLFMASPDMMARGGFDGFFKRVNPSMIHGLGYTEAELLSTPFSEIVHPDDVKQVGAQVSQLAGGSEMEVLRFRVKHKDGRFLHTEWTDVPFVDRGMFFTIGRDITARIALEASLRDALASMTYAERIGRVGSWDMCLATGEGTWSEEAFRIIGFTPGEIKPSTEAMLSIVHADDLERVKTTIAQPLASGEQRQFEMRFVMKDSSIRNILAKMEVVLGADGNPVRLRGTCQDITEQKEADSAQKKLEEQLRVAQKMEAVGSLAGGIAHDFNNLLSVILNYVGFVLDVSPAPDPRRDDLMEIQKAAERAAVLTRQLLAFGRRQVLQPVLLNLNDIASGVEAMLRRVIGEDIKLVQHLDPELGLTMADPGQIEQVAMNLVVNARDAMPDGGTLTLETKNVDLATDQVNGLEAGPYVTFVVSDNGTGMTAETKARLFEPFFTTKPVGKGTGLGLPTVFGIVKQSGGYICVYSEPDMGTTFRVYLPQDTSGMPAVTRAPVTKDILLGTETILVVEDEPAVRNSTSRVLSAAGYTVLTAENGAAALTQCEAHDGPIDLALTDVIMPELGGAPFARELASVRPQTRILFMSGYSGDAIVHQGILDAHTQFIGKPFSASDLTHKVREVLDADRDGYPTDPTEFAPPARKSL